MKRFCVLLGLLILMLPVGHIGADEFEAEMKAEFIERFTRFIEWPAGSINGENFVIGVYGGDSMIEPLNRIAQRGRIKGRTATIKILGSMSEANACQVVFLDTSAAGDLDTFLQTTRGKPVLTVSDKSGYAEKGVMINFFSEGDFIRFEINPTAAQGSGLQVATELLALGRPVG